MSRLQALRILRKLLSLVSKPKRLLLVIAGALFLLGSTIVSTQLATDENQFILEINQMLIKEWREVFE